MISRLRGVPVGRSAEGLVLDVGEVGASWPPPRARSVVPMPVARSRSRSYLHVREDALQLGFADAGERELFVSLLGVSGIGPKVALAVVSSSPPAELRRAIALGDSARFQAIPGIGKTAERIVLELKEKARERGRGRAASRGRLGLVARRRARRARRAHGPTVTEAEQALARVDPELPAEERVREALRSAA